MDKETLSNYGWIVICVMVLAVMLAFASPFGNFVANAIKSTTQGLFDVNQGALDAAGIQIMEQEFDTMLNGTENNNCPIKYGQQYTISEGTFMLSYIFHEDGSLEMAYYENGQLLGSETAPSGTVGYDGLNLTGVDEETGETFVVATITEDGKQIDMGEGMILTLNDGTGIPLGGVYYVGVTSTTTGDYTGATAVYTAGMSFPESPTEGDIYVYGDYEYRYDQVCMGAMIGNYTTWYPIAGLAGVPSNQWYPRVLDMTKTTYGPVIESINGQTIKNLMFTYANCTNLTSDGIPDFSNNITDMTWTFSRCKALTVAPKIPQNVTSLNGTFIYCHELTTAPIIPSGVTDINNMFTECKKMVTYYGSTDPDGDFSNYIIPNGVTTMLSTFGTCESLTAAPAIPSNVKNMHQTFRNCVNLVYGPDMSNAISVEDMSETFEVCSKMITTPDLSKCTKLTNMEGTFNKCYLLTTAPVIPYGVVNMDSTFMGCKAMATTPILPDTVTEMDSTFWYCTSMPTMPTIPSGVTDSWENPSRIFFGCTQFGY